jgi:hypothetical protein
MTCWFYSDDEQRATASDQGLACFIGECQSNGTNASYLVWQPIWKSFFNLNANDLLAKQVETLKTQLVQVAVTAVARLPLLGAVLDLPIEDNDLSRALDAKTLKSSLEAL